MEKIYFFTFHRNSWLLINLRVLFNKFLSFCLKINFEFSSKFSSNEFLLRFVSNDIKFDTN